MYVYIYIYIYGLTRAWINPEGSPWERREREGGEEREKYERVRARDLYVYVIYIIISFSPPDGILL